MSVSKQYIYIYIYLCLSLKIKAYIVLNYHIYNIYLTHDCIQNFKCIGYNSQSAPNLLQKNKKSAPI